MDACVSTPHFAAVPRHYWKTEVEWCDHQISTPNVKWTGYGDATLGVCQSFKDASHTYPRFHQFGSAGGTDNMTTSAFQRVDFQLLCVEVKLPADAASLEGVRTAIFGVTDNRVTDRCHVCA